MATEITEARSELAHRLRDALENRHGSKSGLSRALKVTPTSVGRWVRGETIPDPRYWEAIEAFLDWPTSTIGSILAVEPGAQLRRLRESAPTAEAAAPEVVVSRRLLDYLIDRVEGMNRRLEDVEATVFPEAKPPGVNPFAPVKLPDQDDLDVMNGIELMEQAADSGRGHVERDVGAARPRTGPAEEP